MPYSRLDPAPVRATVARLCARIDARFPGRGLGKVARELQTVVDAAASPPPGSTTWLGWLGWACRAGTVIIGVLVPAALTWTIVDGVSTGLRGVEWLGVWESAINDLVFAGIAILFLWALPRRLQRARDLQTLHRLRSLAHVVDMHQLAKDPERFRTDFVPTGQTIPLDLSPAQLANYLDYCSELLALIGKTAALLAEDNTDPAVLNAVEGLESLTNGMSRKIWAKIALLQRVSPARPTPPQEAP